MRPLLSVSLPALALAGVALTATEAHAKGLVLITTGESVLHYDDLTGEAKAFAAETTGHEVQVGYLYSHFGVFWLDLWTWDGKYCLYQGDNVWELTPDDAAGLLGVKVDELGKPLLYHAPLGLLILLGLGVGLGLFYRFSRD
ncbi:hypothetical protein [Nannocystis bainbridge]|uniref:MYXO-CTERM domain-containing protein n=1 Tax=Nannocystis bainbridge TaxID=2995303 RepID=A0ABT5E7N8_9BACT|nr:hypothetical protein [Nannocystis bainbridge]MDC0721344.1 hypothetical protein [Nannocystis bainbridge]